MQEEATYETEDCLLLRVAGGSRGRGALALLREVHEPRGALVLRLVEHDHVLHLQKQRRQRRTLVRFLAEES